MRFLLANDEAFKFIYDYPHGSKGKYGRFLIKYHEHPNLDGFEKQVSSVLKGMVNHYPCPKVQADTSMLVILCVKESQSVNQGILSLQDNGSFLKNISILFGSDNVRVKIALSFPTFPPMTGSSEISNSNSSSGSINRISTKAMTVQMDSGDTCRDSAVKFPNADLYEKFLYASGNTVQASLSVQVTVNTRFIRPRLEKNGLNLYEKMLHEEIHSDVTITAENGSHIKCHKAVLSACSPVFEAMFKTDMEESKSHNVELTDMSEEAVKSFLNYIYYMNEDGPSKKCSIAFELLNAAHKYDVSPDLESAMTNLILSKPVEWFDVEAGVKIFLFARNIPNNGDALKEKAIQILKENFATLPESSTYAKMFQENPAGAMELCQFAFAALSANKN